MAKMKQRIVFLICSFLTIVLLLFISRFFVYDSCRETIIIGSKNCTEFRILSQIMAILIENDTDFRVEKKLYLEGTFICFEALRSGDIDIYTEYTGTALLSILKEKVFMDTELVYGFVKNEFLKKYDIQWLEPFGFENAYVLLMSKKRADELQIYKISDLASYLKKTSKNLKIAFDPEFFARAEIDCLKETYNFDFYRPLLMDQALLYFSLVNQNIDVSDGFSTDGMIPSLNLQVLEDDRHSFPIYAAAPLIRMDTLKKHPELENILNKLAGRISKEKIQSMNYEADKKGHSAYDIAHDFLISEGLIKAQ